MEPTFLKGYLLLSSFASPFIITSEPVSLFLLVTALSTIEVVLIALFTANLELSVLLSATCLISFIVVATDLVPMLFLLAVLSMFIGEDMGDIYKRIASWISSFDLLAEPESGVPIWEYRSLMLELFASFNAEFKERLSPIDSYNYEHERSVSIFSNTLNDISNEAFTEQNCKGNSVGCS